MPRLSPSRFADMLPTLVKRLTEDLLQEQQDCALTDLANDPLWATPDVDSKTVAKLSPAVKELTGESLDPRWIRRGGYPNVEDAVVDIVAQIKKHLVDAPAAPIAAPEPLTTEATH